MSLEDLVKDGIKNIPAYIPGDTAESVEKKYGIAPEDILKLASNENQFGPSPKAIEAMAKEVGRVHIYPDPFCIEIRKKIGVMNGFDDSGDNVVIAVGASGILSLLGEVFIKKGDEVIFCEPTFGAYAGAVIRNDGTPVVLPLTEDLKFDLKAMYNAITDKTKMICICNPNNPTGTVVDSEELKEFIHKVPKDIIIVVDEAYIELSSNPDVKSMVSEISDDTNVVVARTFSKLYGLAGVRLGYAMCNKEMHAILQKCTSVFTGSRVALAGAMAALDDEEYIKKAISLGATDLWFTDHAPFPDNPFGGRMKYEELSEYISTLKNLKEQYQRQIKIHIGLEIEYFSGYDRSGYYQELSNNPDLEILLLGQHMAEDPEDREHYTFEWPKERLLEDMNTQLLAMR